jgi:hypothetical protein
MNWIPGTIFTTRLLSFVKKRSVPAWAALARWIVEGAPLSSKIGLASTEFSENLLQGPAQTGPRLSTGIRLTFLIDRSVHDATSFNAE